MPLLPSHAPCSESGRNRNVANSWWKSRRSRSAIAAACRAGPARRSVRAPCPPSPARCARPRRWRSCAAGAGRQREGHARVVANEPLDRLAAAQEARHLGQPHPRQGHRHDGLVLPPRAGPDGQPREGGDGRPPTQELEPDVPSAGELTPQGVAGQEALERRVVAPLREDREPPTCSRSGDTVGAPSRISDRHSRWSRPGVAVAAVGGAPAHPPGGAPRRGGRSGGHDSRSSL